MEWWTDKIRYVSITRAFNRFYNYFMHLFWEETEESKETNLIYSSCGKGISEERKLWNTSLTPKLIFSLIIAFSAWVGKRRETMKWDKQKNCTPTENGREKLVNDLLHPFSNPRSSTDLSLLKKIFLHYERSRTRITFRTKQPNKRQNGYV